MKLSEVHSSAVNDEGDPSVVRTGGQRSAVILDPTGTVRAFGSGSIPRRG